MEQDGVTLHPDTCKRIAKDVRSLLKDPLDSEGIYYKHSDTNVLKGYAVIVGNPHGVYHNGIFLFKFQFPADYPYKPPKVTFMTNDGITRFHPNLYRNGKVCLSILNTWAGEKWSSCQSIRSVLLTMSNLLDDNPLLHEPGVSFDTYKKSCSVFNTCIEYKSIEFAYCSLFEKMYINQRHDLNISNIFMMFTDVLYSHFEKTVYDVIKKCDDKIKCTSPCTLDVSMYRDMKIKIDYSTLRKRLGVISEHIISCKNESKNNIC